MGIFRYILLSKFKFEVFRTSYLATIAFPNKPCELVLSKFITYRRYNVEIGQEEFHTMPFQSAYRKVVAKDLYVIQYYNSKK